MVLSPEFDNILQNIDSNLGKIVIQGAEVHPTKNKCPVKGDVLSNLLITSILIVRSIWEDELNSGE